MEQMLIRWLPWEMVNWRQFHRQAETDPLPLMLSWIKRMMRDCPNCFTLWSFLYLTMRSEDSTLRWGRLRRRWKITILLHLHIGALQGHYICALPLLTIFGNCLLMDLKKLDTFGMTRLEILAEWTLLILTIRIWRFSFIISKKNKQQNVK